MKMEKISIVRRRLEMAPTQAELRARERMMQDAPGQVGDGPALAVLPDLAGHAPGIRDAAEVTVDLSPDTREELWSAGHLDETAGGKRHFIVEAEQAKEDGRVVLRLQFMKPEYFLRLLTTEEVCEMLHVSRSSLYQYARTGDLRTYRMGRGLRFRFQDVLDFLTGSQTRIQ
jgi:excisionase family DNA binding protein